MKAIHIKLMILTLVVYSKEGDIPDYFPDCAPKTAKSTYKDTLLIFVMDINIAHIIDEKWYPMKVLACEIPISDNIKTYKLNYHMDNWNENLESSSFYDSKQLSDTVTSPLGELINGQRLGSCERLLNALTNLVGKEIIKNHGNVHILVLHDVEMRCGLAKFEDFNIVWIFYVNDHQYSHTFMTRKGKAIYNIKEQEVRPRVTHVARVLIQSLLTKDESTTALIVLAIVIYIISAVFLAFAVAFILRFLKKKKEQTSLSKDGMEKSK